VGESKSTWNAFPAWVMMTGTNFVGEKVGVQVAPALVIDGIISSGGGTLAVGNGVASDLLV